MYLSNVQVQNSLLFAINSAYAYLSFPGDTYFFPTELFFTKLIITSPLHPYSLNNKKV